MAGFSPGVVEKAPEAVLEPSPRDSPPAEVLRQAVFLRRTHAQGVQSIPDAGEHANAVEGVGVLPGSLRLGQFRDGALPALARPGWVVPAQEAKGITLPASPRQLGVHIAHNGGVLREIERC